MSVATKPDWLTYGYPEAEQLIARLRGRYGRGRYAILEQVRDGPAFYANRTGDVMVMGLWPSRGCELEGIEVKVSRADWLRELKAPQKAESLYAYCDRWWLLVPSAKDIVRDGELPLTWGCIEALGKEKLRTVVPAPKLTPCELDRGFLAALLKRATDEPVARSRLREVYQVGKRDGEAVRAARVEDHAKFRAQVEHFEQAAGIKIGDDWRRTPEETGAAVAAFLEGRHIEKDLAARLGGIRRGLKEALRSIERALGEPATPIHEE